MNTQAPTSRLPLIGAAIAFSLCTIGAAAALERPVVKADTPASTYVKYGAARVFCFLLGNSPSIGCQTSPIDSIRGENGTLAGRDDDGNGIRDDVDQLIDQRLSSDPLVRAEAQTFARHQQEIFFLDPKKMNPTEGAERRRFLLDSSNCSLKSFAKSNERVLQFLIASERIRDQFTNTIERAHHDFLVARFGDGTYYALDEQACATIRERDRAEGFARADTAAVMRKAEK